MLRNEMPGARMQRSGEERAHNQIGQSFDTCISYEEEIESELSDDVEEVDLGQWELVDHHGTEGVEEDLEGAEEGLAEDGVEEEGFKGSWEVGV